jgi:hypothetical protein
LFNASVSQGEARLPVLVLTDETFASIHLQYAAAQQATQADSELQAFVEAFMVPPSSDAETVPCQSLLVAMLNAPRWQTEILCSGPKGKPYVVQASCVFLRYRGKAYDFSGPLHKLAAAFKVVPLAVENPNQLDDVPFANRRFVKVPFVPNKFVVVTLVAVAFVIVVPCKLVFPSTVNVEVTVELDARKPPKK